MAYGSPPTTCLTPPLEFCSRAVLVMATAGSGLAITISSKAVLVPDPDSLTTTLMAWSGPPTSFQFLMTPPNMSLTCALVNAVDRIAGPDNDGDAILGQKVLDQRGSSDLRSLDAAADVDRAVVHRC